MEAREPGRAHAAAARTRGPRRTASARYGRSVDAHTAEGQRPTACAPCPLPRPFACCCWLAVIPPVTILAPASTREATRRTLAGSNSNKVNKPHRVFRRRWRGCSTRLKIWTWSGMCHSLRDAGTLCY
ncbi:hypothetical protein BS78_01G265700 [Paspalum vaginatum]|nr:hypothetical protein BS78_01G265700 [Paspalum vaginatum]